MTVAAAIFSRLVIPLYDYNTTAEKEEDGDGETESKGARMPHKLHLIVRIRMLGEALESAHKDFLSSAETLSAIPTPALN